MCISLCSIRFSAIRHWSYKSYKRKIQGKRIMKMCVWRTKAKGNMYIRPAHNRRARSVYAAINGHARTLVDMVSQWFLKSLGERPSRWSPFSGLISLFLAGPPILVLTAARYTFLILFFRIAHIPSNRKMWKINPLTPTSLFRETLRDPGFLVSSLNKVTDWTTSLDGILGDLKVLVEEETVQRIACHNLEIFHHFLRVFYDVKGILKFWTE